jgi:hypothetical protein
MPKSKWKHPNAQKHAVFSKFLIIGGEDPRQFEKLVDELAEEWQPEGKTEHDAVLDIAKGIWLKRRFQLFLKVTATRNAGNPDHPSYDERIGLAAFLTHAKMSPESAFSHGSHYPSQRAARVPDESVSEEKFQIRNRMVRGDKKCNYFVVVSNLRCCVLRLGDIFGIDELRRNFLGQPF